MGNFFELRINFGLAKFGKNMKNVKKYGNDLNSNFFEGYC